MSKTMVRVREAVAMSAIAIALSSSAPTRCTGQEAGAGGMQMPSAEAMEEAMRVTQPGEHHKLLEAFVGDWDTVTKVWMGGPGSEPSESKAAAHTEWVLGGRFVMNTMKGELFGMPYEGIGLIGYDNYKNMYVGNWASNMGTEILSYTGAADPSGNMITLYGAMDEPMLKVGGRTVKYAYRFIDANHIVMDLYDLHARDDYKVVEVAFTRKP